MIGSTVGNYRIVAKLGDGGMGSVYRAVDEMLDREVAIKVLRPELSQNASLIERFRQEAIALARLNHANIATLHGLERHGESLLMVMEFVRGQTLEAIVQRSGRIAWRRAAELCAEVLLALDHAHDKGVVHRDIKPANIMLDGNGMVKVMDFGIARLMGKNRQTQAGHSVGTPMYMAPEQLRGEEVDGRTDLYAAGAVLFELITGQMAFEADSDYGLMMKQLHEPPPAATSMVPDIPVVIDSIIARAMAKRRDDRFPSATGFREALLHAIASHAPAPRKVPVAPATRLADTPPGDAVPSPPSAANDPQRAAEHAPPPRVVETRLASDARSDDPTPSERRAPATRLADVAPPVVDVRSHVDRHDRPAGERTSSVPATGSDRVRDWRTYAIAATLLVAATLAVRTFRSTPAPTGPVTPEAPKESSVVASTPAVAPVADTAKPVQREDASSLLLTPPPATPRDPAPPVSPPPAGSNERVAPPPVSRNPRPRPEPPTAPPSKGETPKESPKPAEPPDAGARRETPSAAESESAARAAIQDALQNAAANLSGQNTAASTILTGNIAKDWSALMKEGRVSMKIAGEPNIDVAGSHATASFDATVNVRTPFGANHRKTARFSADLTRSSGAWRVTSLRSNGEIELK